MKKTQLTVVKIDHINMRVVNKLRFLGLYGGSTGYQTSIVPR